MGLLVQKFGGTSVLTPERIRSVASRVGRTVAEGNQVVVVVSAMGHTTDELIELAHQVSSSPPGREMDMLLTAGERISMALLSMALQDLRIPAVSFTGSQTGIITDESHRRARIVRILGDRVRAALGEGKVVIVAGFQGMSVSREITTLGRGGSDTTAVAMSAVLGADACEIYTDVDGVFSADPRVVQDARHWKKLPHELMVELATRGAGVLHPRSVQLAKQYGVPLVVRNSLNDREGTWMVSFPESERTMEEFRVVGVTSDSAKLLIRIELARDSVSSAIWDRGSEAHLSITAPFFFGKSVQFFAERDSESEWRKILEKLVIDGFVRNYEVRQDLVPVSVVGDRFSQDGGALSRVMETLARQNILVTIGSASALAITVALREVDSEAAVKALHSEFFPSKGSPKGSHIQ